MCYHAWPVVCISGWWEYAGVFASVHVQINVALTPHQRSVSLQKTDNFRKLQLVKMQQTTECRVPNHLCKFMEHHRRMERFKEPENQQESSKAVLWEAPPSSWLRWMQRPIQRMELGSAYGRIGRRPGDLRWVGTPQEDQHSQLTWTLAVLRDWRTNKKQRRLDLGLPHRCSRSVGLSQKLLPIRRICSFSWTALSGLSGKESA